MAGFADIAGNLRVAREGDSVWVAKRRQTAAARAERDLAAEAASRLRELRVPIVGVLHVAVPDLIELDEHTSVLLTPFLGTPLSAASASTSPGAVSEHDLLCILDALQERGVEAPGLVPRNLFRTADGLALIDWEDAALRPPGSAPTALTVMKWDAAWSDYFRRDLRLRDSFTPHTDGEASVDLDAFETVLAGWLPEEWTKQQVRDEGIALTLKSELFVPSAAPASAAALGHLADDVLPQPLSVFHTLVTARIRSEQGTQCYARLLRDLHSHLPSRRPTPDERAAASRRWSITLLDEVERYWAAHSARQPLAQLAKDQRRLAEQRGWQAARRRALLAERVLGRVAAAVQTALGLPALDVLLRGSCAQGILGLASDIDFELSSAQFPRGHTGAEELVALLLAQFGFDSEGSAGRPAETDVIGPDARVSRDLHEWMELRRPGSPRHDPGWTRAAVNPPSRQALGWQPSQYEADLVGPDSAKRLWFETRAAVARLVFRAAVPDPPVDLDQQLDLLPKLTGSADAAELRVLCLTAFDLRESTTGTGSPDLLPDVRQRLTRLRDRLRLPGPAAPHATRPAPSAAVPGGSFERTLL